MKKILLVLFPLVVILFASLLVITITASPALADCRRDSDCRGRQGDRNYCDPGGKGTCVQCINNNHCGKNEECKQQRCQPKNNGGGGGGGGGGDGGGTTTTTSGSDAGGSDSSDPTPARVGVEDCAVNGKANAGVMTELGLCIPKDPAGFAAAYYRVGLGLIGGLAVLFIIFGGYLFLTSGGNPERLNNGKTFLFYALFGLLLAIFGYVFIEVIAVDILRLPGFGR